MLHSWKANSPYIIMRSGREIWTAGQILYIVLSSAIFFAIVELLTILLLLPNLSYENDWGKVINSFAQNGASRYGVVFPFDYTIVSNFNPLQAMVIESLLCWLMGMFVGLLMFVLTLRSVGAPESLPQQLSPFFPFLLNGIIFSCTIFLRLRGHLFL